MLALSVALVVVAAPGSAPHATPAQATAGSEAALHQAEQAFQDGRLDEALSKCRQAIELNPKSAHAYYLLGGIQAERGAQEEARKALRQSLNLDSSRVATHIFLARLYFQSKDLADAAQQFEAAVKLGDSTGVARYGLGLVMVAQSRYAEALPHLEAAVEASPRDPERLLTLLVTELQLKHADKAREDLARMEKLSEDDPWLSYRVGKLLREHGMNKEADAEFERVAQSLTKTKETTPPPDVNLADFYLQIAQVEFKHRDYPAALVTLDKVGAGSLDSRLQAAAWYLRGASLVALGKVQDGREDLSRAAQGDVAEPEYVVRLTWADLLAGDREAAEAQANLARSKWPDLPLVQHILALVARERAPERARIPYAQHWHAKGEGLVCCPCKVPCPCRSNAPPSYNRCENVGVFRISRGRYGQVALDGFVFAIVSNDMGREDIPATLYVSDTATDGQVIALERLAQSFNLLRPSIFLNVKRAPISFASPEATFYVLKIPSLLDIKIRRQLDAHGKPLMATAALDYFSNQIEYAQNLVYKLWDQDGSLQWDYSGRQANYREFDLDSAAYLNRTMLIQFADFTGFFNPQQLELIKAQKLPLLPSYPRPEKPGL